LVQEREARGEPQTIDDEGYWRREKNCIRNKQMDDEDLLESMCDQLLAARNNIRVIKNKQGNGNRENSQSYFMSLFLDIPNDVHAALAFEAEKTRRSLDAVLRRFAILAFRTCFEPRDEPALKEAA
jgi:hypothetical protein